MPDIFRRRSSKLHKQNDTAEIARAAATSESLSVSIHTIPSSTTTSAEPTREYGDLQNPFASIDASRSTVGGAEAPPAYTAPDPAAASTTDNPYAFLSTFDTVFLIDDSGSMAGDRWRQTSAALTSITSVCTSHDKDGIDLYFLNTQDHPSFRNVTEAAKVESIFSMVLPGGGTPTGQRLNNILRPYMARLERKGRGRCEEVKPLNIIVITDGEAHDDPESVILSCAKKLDRLEAPGWQIGIQFFQVGKDAEATRALKEMDDGLIDLGCERDMVDTIPWNGENGQVGLNADGVLKCVLGSVNRRLDRKRVSLHSA